jgi:hypothetical protein
MADKPSYKMARDARGTATMSIEPMPKTSFTDKNLDGSDVPSGGEKISSDPATAGGSISPSPNAPKQTSHGSGSTHPDPEGLTRT